MMRATRVQGEYDMKAASDESQTFFHTTDENGEVVPIDPPITRQEEAANCDINRILQRGGITAYTRTPTYGEIDFDLTLARAVEIRRQADQLWSQLPIELRRKYANVNDLNAALANGELGREIQLMIDKHHETHPDTSPEANLLWLRKELTARAPSVSTETAPPPKNSSQSAPVDGSAATK